MKINRKKVLRTLLVIVGLLVLMYLFVAQPSWSKNSPVELSANSEKLQAHVAFLSVDCYPRNYKNRDNLDKAASYIALQFESAGCSVERQEFNASGKEYYNVIGRLNAGKGHKIVVGAHYDSHGDTPGADDNASGVAGLIELAHLLAKADLNYEVELVAYTLEEPPFFGGNRMGSAIHADRLNEKKESIEGVIVLEMIGYFSDESFSQSFPMPLLYLMYPWKGNFITVVGSLEQMSFTRSVKVGMQGSTDLPVYSINAPASLPGIDFSDHRNYWPHGYNAVMITDTAFYRNKAYHHDNDTVDRLDFNRMGKVVLSVYNYLLSKKNSL